MCHFVNHLFPQVRFASDQWAIQGLLWNRRCQEPAFVLANSFSWPPAMSFQQALTFTRACEGVQNIIFFPGMPKETDGCRCRRTSERRRQCGKVGLLILACPVRLTHRGSWRPNSVTTKPNSSPPKRRRNTRWTRWPWSWS